MSRAPILVESPRVSNPRKTKSFLKKLHDSRQLYLLMLIPLVYLLIFKYYPMLGAQIAFRQFTPRGGIWGSPWVGLANFERFVNSYMFSRVIINTIRISVYQLVFAFPFPILLALSLTYTKGVFYRKTVQMVTYAPHFISTVVVVGIIFQFFGTRQGYVNNVISLLGWEKIEFLGSPGFFPHIFVWSGVWQRVGYSSIIYFAVLSSISPALHEAAIVDGASKMQRIRHVDIPGILPTAIILLIMDTGRILEVGFEKTFLLQNPLNLRTSEVLSTYVYKIGLASNLPDFSYGTAIGLFKAVIGLVLLTSVNRIAKSVTESSLW
jgi:putative aldouronate transport system permease protein